MKKIIPFLMATVITAYGVMATTPAEAQSITMYKEPPFEGYKVSPGDSFWFIAERYGLNYRELMRLNPEVDPLRMQVGSTIRLKAPVVTGREPRYNNSASNVEAQVARLVNQERQQHGLQPLQHRADIQKVAERKAADMINSNYFSHNSPNYGSPFDMMRTFGISYRAAGENIAKGQRTAEEVMRDWMNSPGHRANILNRDFNSIGVGYYNGAWVQMFVQS